MTCHPAETPTAPVEPTVCTDSPLRFTVASWPSSVKSKSVAGWVNKANQNIVALTWSWASGVSVTAKDDRGCSATVTK